ncbi:hypothetical protein ABKN59_007511 [Abortiporus biennis]
MIASASKAGFHAPRPSRCQSLAAQCSPLDDDDYVCIYYQLATIYETVALKTQPQNYLEDVEDVQELPPKVARTASKRRPGRPEKAKVKITAPQRPINTCSACNHRQIHCIRLNGRGGCLSCMLVKRNCSFISEVPRSVVTVAEWPDTLVSDKIAKQPVPSSSKQVGNIESIFIDLGEPGPSRLHQSLAAGGNTSSHKNDESYIQRIHHIMPPPPMIPKFISPIESQLITQNHECALAMLRQQIAETRERQEATLAKAQWTEARHAERLRQAPATFPATYFAQLDSFQKCMDTFVILVTNVV